MEQEPQKMCKNKMIQETALGGWEMKPTLNQLTGYRESQSLFAVHAAVERREEKKKTPHQ